MITSNDCWLKTSCKKYLTKDDCECKNDDVFCMKLFKLDHLYEQSLLSDEQRNRLTLVLDASEIDKKAFIYLSQIEKTIENFVNDGKNLYIYSETTGNGKSSWAIRLMQEYFNAIWYKTDLDCKGLFISVPKFLLSMKYNITNPDVYYNHIKDNVFNADLVIWDDICTKMATSFEHEHLLSILDNRIINNKSNIFTSNIPPNKLVDFMGDRLYSRIINWSQCIQFKGTDKRTLFK